MKKTIFCLFLALCLCLCMVLASCKHDEEPDTPPDDPTQGNEELGEKKGNIYYTADPGGDVSATEPNEPVEDGTVRY